MEASTLSTEQLILERELRERAKIRRHYGAWCNKALWSTKFRPAAHHRLLIEHLQWLADTPNGRLMVTMPPGSAKTTYVSQLLPAWWLGRGEGSDRGVTNVIGASHTDDLAGRISLKVQAYPQEFGPSLGYSLASEARGLWRTSLGGEYKASGVGTGIAGFRADLALIDDPFKSRLEADSVARRSEVWDWYHDDLLNRLRPGGRVALVMTRWHPDDLAGRILDKHPGEFRVLSLPAIAESDDPLGRLPGEPLWADDSYGYGARLAEIYRNLEETGDLRGWWSLYQQSPRNPEGSLFKVGAMPRVAAVPDGRAVRAWDLAGTEGTKGDPDWTVGLKLVTGEDGRWTVADVERGRWSPAQVEAKMKETAARDGRGVAIGIPQDPGQAGKAQVQYLTKALKGFVVRSSVESGDKVTRAEPAASQAEVGNIAVLQAGWTEAFVAELRDFPAGKKDDQVDALSRAFGMAALGPMRSRRIRVNLTGR